MWVSVVVGLVGLSLAAAGPVNWGIGEYPKWGCPELAFRGGGVCGGHYPRTSGNLACNIPHSSRGIKNHGNRDRCCAGTYNIEGTNCPRHMGDYNYGSACVYTNFYCTRLEITGVDGDEKCLGVIPQFIQSNMWRDLNKRIVIEVGANEDGSFKGICKNLDDQTEILGTVTSHKCDNPSFLPNGPMVYGMNRVAQSGRYDHVFVTGEENSVTEMETYRIFQVKMPPLKDVYVWMRPNRIGDNVVIPSITSENPQAATVEITSHDEWGFVMNLIPSPFCETPHGSETVNIMAMRIGQITTEDGQIAEAGRITINSDTQQTFSANFKTPMKNVPVVYVAIQGWKGRFTNPDKVRYIIPRLDSVTETGFTGGLTGARTLYCTPDDDDEICKNNEPYDFPDLGNVRVGWIAIDTDGKHQGLFGEARYWSAIGGEVKQMDDGKITVFKAPDTFSGSSANSSPIAITSVMSLKSKVPGMSRISEASLDSATVQFTQDTCGEREALPLTQPELQGVFVVEGPKVEDVGEPPLPPCDTRKVNLELMYIQEHTLSFCGEGTCPYASGGNDRLVKQQAIKDHFFDAVDKLKTDFASVKINYTEFCDKNLEPFGQANLDFCWKFFNSMTPYDANYRSWIEDHWRRKWTNTASGRDQLENQLDALISTVARSELSYQSRTGGKLNLRVAVIHTDKAYHTFGDVQAAHPTCKDASGKELCGDYTPSADDCNCVGNEYPSLTQAVDVLSQYGVSTVTLLGRDSNSAAQAYEALGVALNEATGGVLMGVTIRPPSGSTYGEFDPDAFRAGIEAVCQYTQKNV